MTSEAITNLFSDAIRAAIPESSLTVSQWADSYRYLPPERSARPGRWRTSLVPYTREIMDAASRSDVRRVVFVKPTQIAGTETINNVIGFYIHSDPSAILYACETEAKAKAWSQECLAPMIRDTPVLLNLVEEARTRDSGNTIEGKSFPGGHLAIAWATSAATASSRPRRIVAFDERDAYKPTSEGDFCLIAEERTNTYENSLVLETSTPRDREEPPPGSDPEQPRLSPIERAYEASDKRKYFVPCPHCGEFQTLEWSNIHWDSEETVQEAYYICSAHGCVIEHDYKQEMLARGQWRAEKPFRGTAGFFLWAGYSPFVTWGQLAEKWIEAQKSVSKLRVFINTSLAQGWEPITDKIELDGLETRTEDYPAEVPRGVLVLTASADVQGDRLEYEIVGWGLDDESWSIRRGVLLGDPAQPAVWKDLEEIWTEGYLDEDGREHFVRAACVDSGGHHTSHVYRFCHKHARRRWYAVKGANTPGKPLVSKPTRQGKPAVWLYTIGTETAKDTISAHLKIEEPGPGYCHFPKIILDSEGAELYDEAYFKQLCSEKAITKYRGGKGYRAWVKIKQSARNEALDLRVYAMAALDILNPNFRRLHKKAQKVADTPEDGTVAEAAESLPPVEEITPEPEPEEEPSRVRARKPFVKRFKKGFVHNW